MENNILIVGGDFDNFGGRRSEYVEKLSVEIKNKDCNCQVINGGRFADLQNFFETNSLNEMNFVVWMPNIPKSYPKIHKIQSIIYKVIFVKSKNSNSEYPCGELAVRAKAQKSNLAHIGNNEGEENIVAEIIDTVGNSLGKSGDIENLATILINRMRTLCGMERKPTVRYTVDEAFLGVVNKSGKILPGFIDRGTSWYAGNSSFRCIQGLPSQRITSDIILVSKRNFEKESISKDDFIVAWMDDDSRVNYFGDKKPHFDTPLQLLLYKRFPEINYIVQNHCYIKNAPFTNRKIPCGAMQEVEKIISVYTNTKSKIINLLGHGSIVLAQTLNDFKAVHYYARPMLEPEVYTSDNITERKCKPDWILTDDDSSQHVRKIDDNTFDLIEMSMINPETLEYEVYEDSICIADYTDTKKLNGVLSSFGYKDVDAVKQIYGEKSMQIVAECIFEYYGSNEARRIFKGNMEECKTFIKKYIKNIDNVENPRFFTT